jgi:hypothetical protein
MCLFIYENASGSFMMEHHFISPHCRTALDPDFWWIVVRTRRPINWPARSPDLNSLDFWLWGHLKTSVYSAPINDLYVLQKRVENACHEFRVKPGIFNRVHTSARRRAESCVKMHEKHKENPSYVSRHLFLEIHWLLYLLKTCNSFLIPCILQITTWKKKPRKTVKKMEWNRNRPLGLILVEEEEEEEDTPDNNSLLI